jgi:hypothetical protein
MPIFNVVFHICATEVSWDSGVGCQLLAAHTTIPNPSLIQCDTDSLPMATVGVLTPRIQQALQIKARFKFSESSFISSSHK